MTAPLELLAADDREPRLLIHCARASIASERADRIRGLAASTLDWKRVLALAARNNLRPLLYWHLRTICPASVPAATLEFLRDYFQKNCAFNLMLTGELLRLLAVLRQNGIEAVPFKGPALAARLYGHVGLRQFCDLDILVRPRDVWRASQVIEREGFEAHAPVPEERRAAFLRQDYVRLFHRDGRRTIVELHWSVAPQSFAARFDADAVWRRLAPMALEGQTVFMPSAEDLVLMLCVHGSRHGWDKLEGLCSLAALMQTREGFDWDYAWRHAREMRCSRMLAFAIGLVHGLFEVPLPREAAALIESRAFLPLTRQVVDDLTGHGQAARTPARQTAFHLRLKDSYSDCVRSCAGLVFTATPDDWAAVRLRGPLAYGYPLVRALRVARKHRLTQHKATGGCQ